MERCVCRREEMELLRKDVWIEDSYVGMYSCVKEVYGKCSYVEMLNTCFVFSCSAPK